MRSISRSAAWKICVSGLLGLLASPAHAQSYRLLTLETPAANPASVVPWRVLEDGSMIGRYSVPGDRPHAFLWALRPTPGVDAGFHSLGRVYVDAPQANISPAFWAYDLYRDASPIRQAHAEVWWIGRGRADLPLRIDGGASSARGVAPLGDAAAAVAGGAGPDAWVVGWAGDGARDEQGNLRRCAVRWFAAGPGQPIGVQVLDTLPGFDHANANAVNSHGIAVGESFMASPQSVNRFAEDLDPGQSAATLWIGDRASWLEDHVRNLGGWRLVRATAINEAGVIGAIAVSD